LTIYAERMSFINNTEIANSRNTGEVGKAASLNQDNINKLVTEALAIEAEEAREAGALGFMARALTQATMPHRNVEGTEFTRTNGTFTLSMLSPSQVGLPYGTIPRLLVAWLTTEAVRTKESTLILGPSLSSFMSELDLVPTGGRWGSITRLREQSKRLFSCSVSCTFEDDDRFANAGYRIARKADLWWNPKSPEQATLWRSTVELSQDFFDEVTTNPVPIDLRALKALKRSPLTLDIYVWLTYRMSYLRRDTVIPWVALETQFGSDYALTRQFKASFLKQLRKVRLVYQDVKISPTETGLKLSPSKTHIPRISK